MKVQRPSGPKGNLLLGNVADFNVSQLDFLLQAAETYGPITFFRLANMPIYLVSDSELVREVLVTQRDNFPKSPFDVKVLGKFLGNGLITSEGSFHQRQRRLAQPAFHSNRIRNYAETMVAYTQALLAQWQDAEERDVAADMMHLTMWIVAKTLFNADAVTQTDETAVSVAHAIHDLQKTSNADYRRGFLLPDWLPTANNRLRQEAVVSYNQTVEQIIAERRRSSAGGDIADTGDLLSMLMLARDEDGSAMTDQQLRDEVATLFAAGHETTSNALAWTWYLLAQYPDVEAKLHAELDRVLHGRWPTLADLPQLPYTLMVIKEAMRLYPPAWILNGRTAVADTELGGYTIPKGSNIFISPYVMHRLSRHYEQPNGFMPERWTPEFEKGLPKYAYMPFGGGPRICIGNSFAMMEAQLIVAAIAQQYRLRLTSDEPVTPLSQITLSPQDGLRMQLTRRHPVAERESAAELAFA